MVKFSGQAAMLLTGLERDREKVDQKYAWNLADIYPDAAAWRAD